MLTQVDWRQNNSQSFCYLEFCPSPWLEKIFDTDEHRDAYLNDFKKVCELPVIRNDAYKVIQYGGPLHNGPPDSDRPWVTNYPVAQLFSSLPEITEDGYVPNDGPDLLKPIKFLQELSLRDLGNPYCCQHEMTHFNQPVQNNAVNSLVIAKNPFTNFGVLIPVLHGTKYVMIAASSPQIYRKFRQYDEVKPLEPSTWRSVFFLSKHTPVFRVILEKDQVLWIPCGYAFMMISQDTLPIFTYRVTSIHVIPRIISQWRQGRKLTHFYSQIYNARPCDLPPQFCNCTPLNGSILAADILHYLRSKPKARREMVILINQWINEFISTPPRRRSWVWRNLCIRCHPLPDALAWSDLGNIHKQKRKHFGKR